jgi:orotate phosphoribosyltransferase
MDNNMWFAMCQEAGMVEQGHFILSGDVHTDEYVNFATLLSRRGELLETFILKVAAHLRSPIPFVFVGTGNGAHFMNLVVQELCQQSHIISEFITPPKSAYASRFEPGGRLEFRRGQGAVVKNAPVVIIDDVYVTGKTMGELEELVYRSGGTLHSEVVLLNRTSELITERRIVCPADIVVPFHAVFQWSSDLWPTARECPQCHLGLPINLEVGQGAAYHRINGHPVIRKMK